MMSFFAIKRYIELKNFLQNVLNSLKSVTFANILPINPEMFFRIGTRGSKLALWQANWVATCLQNAGATVEIVPIETKGDKILHKTLAKIGSKGVFTEELETALREKHIDIAVHSAKDMPSKLEDGLKLMAFSEREQAHDVVISYNQNFRLEKADSTFLVGTSSTRRVAMLKRFYPVVKTTDARGNLQTRMKKLESGEYDALILAYAGVKRMGYEARICQHLPLEVFTPAVGQGSIAIESMIDMAIEKQMLVREAVNHFDTETCLVAERSFLETLQGGCSVPVFGLATLESGNLTLSAGIVSLDGKQYLKHTRTLPASEAQHLGRQVGEELLAMGADKILAQIKQKINFE
jgi:hydroxymethylbilane synthase